MERRREFIEKLREQNPKLAAFEDRLLAIRKQTEEIAIAYRNQELTQDEAKTQLRPLLKEEMEIKMDPEYLVEQRLTMFFMQQAAHQDR
jgi:hypothetical protein